MNHTSKENIPLADIMNTRVVTLSTENTVDEAVVIFKNNSFHHIPVVNAVKEVVGMISTTDLERISLGMSVFGNAQKEKYNESLFRSLRVADVMAKDIVALDSQQTLQDAYRIFWQGTVRCLPIVDDGILVGIVSPLDLIGALLNET